MKRTAFWINFGGMQASWWACILGAAHGMSWPGVVVVTLFAAWQLSPERCHPADRITVLRFVAVGLVLDSLWPLLGVVAYAHPGPVPGLTPAWLLLLWVALALTVHHSMAYFKRRWQLFVLLTTVGSPMSYAAAARLGAVEWIAPAWVVVLCMGPVWALVVGLLLRQADRSRADESEHAVEELSG